MSEQGQVDEAMAHYRQALKTKPDFAEAHAHLGDALADSGQFDEAIVHYHKALKIKPDLAEAHASLGFALATQGRLTRPSSIIERH